MKPRALSTGLALLAAAWAIAMLDHSMTAHMLAHMTAVAVAAPFVALGVAGSRFDPAQRWPRLVRPVQMSLVELCVVSLWHVPATRAFAAGDPLGLTLEQLSFAAAGLLFWSACFGASDSRSSARRALAVAALLLATMHMTLLGALLTLAPQTLYDAHAITSLGLPLSPLEDQQLAGVVMLALGGGSYLAGGVWLTAGLLREPRQTAARP